MIDVTLEKQTVLETVFVSQTGPVREHNEDSIIVAEGAEHGVPGKGTLLVVADGMGGMDAGERASSMVTTELPTIYFESDITNTVECLVQSVAEINRRVYEAGGSSQSGKGMGTTIVTSVIVDERLITVNVGDSRAYLFHDGKLRQLSRDHSMRKEFFSPFESNAQDLSHVLTQAIGPQPAINPHVNICRIAEGDLILLCSDGLTSVLSDSEIRNVLSDKLFIEAADELLARVYDKNGDDNVSIILSKVIEVIPAKVVRG
jgi:protein phosphatase